ncbi:MAG: N-acetyltransferase [Caldilinea sp. CFX5]|nr:N-acetyltransferase [Caldilinea sp. CFX5]
MTIQFVPVTLTDLLPTLQQYLGAFPSPIDSFLEDHILASNHYAIHDGDRQIGWAAVYQQSLLTQFALLPGYRQLGQRVFALARKLEEVQAAFVPTCDEFFLAHALDDYRQLEKQAYFFQHDPQRLPYQAPPGLRHRPAILADLPTFQALSGDFFDKLEQRLAAGQLYITERGATADCVGFGIIDQGRLLPTFGSCGMFTVAEHRNQGIGPAIITHLIGCCHAQGLRPVAGCWYYNHRSKKTLEKAGLFSATRLLKISY